MEEKLAKLILAINECSDKSDKIYFEIEFSGKFKDIELEVRYKEGHSLIEKRTLYLEDADTEKIDDLIKFVEEYR